MVDSSRFDVLASDEKAELFRSFRKQLKITTKSRDRKKKKSKREKRRRENEKKQKGSDAHGGKDAKTVVDDNGEIVEEEGTTPDSEKAEGGESDKVEDISVQHHQFFYCIIKWELSENYFSTVAIQ